MKATARPIAVLILAAAIGCSNAAPPTTSTNDFTPKVRWMFEPLERGAIVSTPFVGEDQVFIGAIEDRGLNTRGAVYCLDRSTGKPIWKFDADGEMQHMFSSPCVADGRLYIGEGMHANLTSNLYCLDAATGKELWRRQTAGHVESSPTVQAGRVFFAAGDDGVWCLDAVTGKLVWHFQGPLHFDGNPQIVYGQLFVGSGISRQHKRTELLCLAAESGEVVWRKEFDLPIWGSPVRDGDDLFVPLGNGRLAKSVEPPEKPAGALLCLNPQTREQRWRVDVPDGVLARPAVDRDRVYFSCRDGILRAVDRTSGVILWKHDMGCPIVTAPALQGDRVIAVGIDGRIAALRTDTGKSVWQFDVGKHSGTKPRMFSSPVALANEKVGTVIVGAELRGSLNSAAALYCLTAVGNNEH